MIKEYLGRSPILSNPEAGETLLLYLAVSDKATSAALVRSKGEVQRPVYNISKALKPDTQRPKKCCWHL